MNSYQMIIKAKDIDLSYSTLKKLILLFNGKILQFKTLNGNYYTIKTMMNKKAFKYMTKLTVKSNNIKKSYIIKTQ